jgi:heat shock protein HslJ
MSKKHFNVKRALLLTGIFVLCGMILTSVDNCEEDYTTQYELPDFENDSEKAASGASVSSGQEPQRTRRQVEQGQQPTEQTQQSAGQSRQPEEQAKPVEQTQPPAGQAQQSVEQARQPPGQAQQPAVVAGNQPGSRSAQQQSGNQQAGGTAQAAVSSIGGKEWKLIELRKGSVVTVINRKKLDGDGFGDLFTINFGEKVTGKAAPNRFNAPYQAGANNALTIQPPVSTLMASIYDPERIHEQDYFEYLTNVKSWKLTQGRLELYSSDPYGKETVLVYGD